MAAFQRAGIEFVLVRHEGSAGFMADAVSQRTGGLGVCVSTLGPGATNLVSGVAQAYTERSRVLAIIGQCEDELRLTYTHQIIDQEAIFTPIASLFHRLRPSYITQQLRRIFRQVDEVSMPVVLEVSSKFVSDALSGSAFHGNVTAWRCISRRTGSTHSIGNASNIFDWV